MKLTKYLAAAAILPAMLLTSCQDTKEYDAYVETLKEQPAIIESISTPQSYAAYLDSLTAKAEEFGKKDVKLSSAQAEEIEQLGKKIQEALTAAHERLAQTPDISPADIAVPE